MNKLFRNPEFERSMILHILFSAIVVVMAYIFARNYVIASAVICFVFILLHAASAAVRYRKIAKLSANIDKILHGNDKILIDNYSEGEIGILQSEIYKMTVRLREQQQNLQSDKMYLADSIADISHQIRTPLTSINLIVEMLSKPDVSEKQRIMHCRDLKDLLKRIDWLITSLLKISKLDAGTVEFSKVEIPMSEFIKKACSPLLVPIELREQTLEIEADGSFCGDIDWTLEAVGNILKNCMEHTPSGGTLSVKASENPLYSEIIISDTGCGISKKDLPHIFERFYKGDKSNNNSFGIGLALARMIIKEQNGSIKAESRPICGAEFTVRFYKSAV